MAKVGSFTLDHTKVKEHHVHLIMIESYSNYHDHSLFSEKE